jgi:large subunit ribosomal protein L32
MGPLPKRKISRRRRNNRRSHDALTLQHLVRCDNCNEYKPAHQVCPHCGTYAGRQVFQIETDKA